MITFDCDTCGHSVRVKDEFAGRKGKCPKCGAVLQIPGDAPEPEPVTAESASEATPVAPPVRADEPPDPLAQLAQSAARPAPKRPTAPPAAPVAAPAPRPAAPEPKPAKAKEAKPPKAETARPATPDEPAERPPGRLPPKYAAMKGVAIVFLALGLLLIVIGLSIGAVGLLRAGTVTYETSGVEKAGQILTAAAGPLLAAAAMVLNGVMLVGLGQLFVCVRDIAQNTYYLRRL